MESALDLTGGPVLLALSIITACFSLATCGLRLFARFRISHEIGKEDYAIGVAAILAFIGTIFSMIEGTAVTSARAIEFNILGQPFYLISATLAKISICFSFIALAGVLKAWRVVLSIMMLLMAFTDLSSALTTNLQCQPLEKLWEPQLDGACWDPSVQANIGYFRGTLSAISWLVLSVMPVFILRGLGPDNRALKWPFYGLSALSVIAGIFTAVQTYETSNIPMQTGIYTYSNFLSTLFSVFEQNVGIVAANFAHVGPLFSRRQRQLASRTDSIHDPFKQGRSGGASHSSGDSGSVRSLGALARLNGLSGASKSTLTGVQGRDSFELGIGRSGSTRSVVRGGVGRSESRRSNRSNSASDGADDADAAAVGGGQWPQGIIIKTVEVEVTVQESTREVVTSDVPSRPSAEYNWDRMLRDGRPTR
ncbi:hypothetical protein PpBr36_06984 [Pyricularia pennisetigena]|uniref:hypothetical protein n=1 Tax=Pyricularia pennisetigena TaxID=1578925 RepID=UPI001153331C|nr:hypothetical protein PpBr36_06984 [Pyricularia pennisetigena]TLS25188.1 hypothetical protein PpBr36_06984 [Pyricularia pennisetigena]